jgi:3-methyladenine DNA glycosylase AlkD
MHMNLDPQQLEREIVARVEALENRSTAPVRAIRREFSRRLKGADAGVVIDLALRLKQHDSFDYRVIAQELVASHPPAFARLDEDLLLRFGEPLDSWWTVDSFGLDLAGAAWRSGQIEDALVERWARSEDRWWRRLALVCTVPLNLKSRGGTGDAAKTLHICTLLVDDRDDMVVKALSWALRALSQRDRAAVEALLAEHEKRLASRVMREVRSKLATGLKNPRRA